MIRRIDPEADPRNWALTQNNLGTAYANLPTGDRSKNLAKAIVCLEAALRVYTERDFPADWAMTQNNLGFTYASLPTGNGENLANGIACRLVKMLTRPNMVMNQGRPAAGSVFPLPATGGEYRSAARSTRLRW